MLTVPKTCVFNATKKLFTSKVNLLFFDVTTLYFESIEEDELRKFGYSKDFRFNTTQLVLALASDENGLPIGYELFAGNKAEVSTLIEALNKWREQFDIGSVCMVGDRAMLSEKNLQLLEENNIEYIVAAKLKKLRKDFTEELFDEANYKINVMGNQLAWVGEFNYKARRLIVSYKTRRAQKDRKDRVRLIEKVQKLIDKKTQQITAKKVITNAALKKYTIADNKQSRYKLNEEKMLEEAKWDGLHGVITNIKDSSPTDILSIYARLWVIEDCFRVNKHTLKMRPIYHWVKPRIEAHIAICYMGFAVLRHLQYRVNLTTKLSVHEIIDVLSSVQSSILFHCPTGNYYRMPGVTSQKASKIYKSFGLIRSQTPAPYLK